MGLNEKTSPHDSDSCDERSIFHKRLLNYSTTCNDLNPFPMDDIYTFNIINSCIVHQVFIVISQQYGCVLVLNKMYSFLLIFWIRLHFSVFILVILLCLPFLLVCFYVYNSLLPNMPTSILYSKRKTACESSSMSEIIEPYHKTVS